MPLLTQIPAQLSRRWSRAVAQIASVPEQLREWYRREREDRQRPYTGFVDEVAAQAGDVRREWRAFRAVPTPGQLVRAIAYALGFPAFVSLLLLVIAFRLTFDALRSPRRVWEFRVVIPLLVFWKIHFPELRECWRRRATIESIRREMEADRLEAENAGQRAADPIIVHSFTPAKLTPAHKGSWN